MNTFNTQDYDFLLKTLNQGSLIFKSQSLKRLLTLAINDKKQFFVISKQVLFEIQSLYLQEKQDINLTATLIVSEIVSSFNTKDQENLIVNHHLQSIIKNLGHPTKPAVRKASHTFLLAFLRAYNNFNSLIKGYTGHGLNDQNSLIQQKTINSLQSILILELKRFDWSSQQSKTLIQTLLLKANDENNFVAKAATQCLVSMCKIDDIKIIVKRLSIGYMLKIKDFLNNAIQTINPDTLKITPQDIQKLIEGSKKPKRIEEEEIKILKPTIHKIEQPQQKDLETIKINPSHNTTQRRLQKIRSSIKNQSRKSSMIEKQPVQTKFFGNVVLEGSIKQKTNTVQQLLFKVQSNIDKPEFQASIKLLIPSLIKMLKDNNPKIVGITLKILQTIIEYINPNEKNFNSLVNVIVDKLGDAKISIRQSVCKVIKDLIRKTKKNMWLTQLIQNMKKNTNTFLRDQTLGLILNIFQQTPKQQLDCNFQQILDNIVIYSDDPKTKIKIRTLDCLAQIVFVSQEIQRHSQNLKSKMPTIFYQMYVQKLKKLEKQRQRQNHDKVTVQKKIKDQFTVTSRTSYQSKSNEIYVHKRNESEGNQSSKVHMSMDIVKRKVSLLKKPRGLMSTQQTASVDNISQRTIERSLDNTIQDLQVVLPSLYKKTTQGKFINRRNQNSYSPSKTIDHKNLSSDYLSKQQLTPLREPQREFKEIMNAMKSSDWKVLFQTTNKLRRLVQFDSNLVTNSSQGVIHNLLIEVVSMAENLRSSVSKNALICLAQLIIVLQKQLDSQIDLIFDKIIKKAADTNIFISSQVQKVMSTLSVCATSSKILDKINQFRDNKSIPIKQTCLNCLLAMREDQRIRQKQYVKLTQNFAYYLFDSSQQIRNKAKSGIILVCDDLGDWYRALRGKINPSYFKSICEIMTKRPSSRENNQRYNTIRQTPIKKNSSTKQDFATIKSQNISLPQSPSKKEKVESIKRKQIKISNFPTEFESLQGYFEQCTSSDWKKRIESLNKVKELALQYETQFMQYRSANHFIDTICKHIIEPNTKVSLNGMSVLQQIIQPLKSLVENNLSLICNSVFNCLSSNKSEIKQKSQDLTETILQQIEIQSLLQYLSHGILYSLPKSRVCLLNKLRDNLSEIHEKKKQLLFKYVFPLMNKLMDEYKSDLVPSIISFFNKLFDLMGNQMYSHLTKFKQVKELINR